MIEKIPLSKIKPNPYQPESRLNIPDEIAEKLWREKYFELVKKEDPIFPKL